MDGLEDARRRASKIWEVKGGPSEVFFSLASVWWRSDLATFEIWDLRGYSASGGVTVNGLPEKAVTRFVPFRRRTRGGRKHSRDGEQTALSWLSRIFFVP